MTDVSIVIVNFNSGEYLPGCLDSLARAAPAGRSTEVLVVENGSTLDQGAWLDAARARGARVLDTGRNGGYAGGCNRGLAASSGRFVLFLNADVQALPGSIDRLLAVLEERADVGLVEPRTYIDADRAFRIPLFEPLTPWELVLAGLGSTSARAAERLARRRVRRTLPYWRATAPREQLGLTGAFLTTRRATVEALGGFDESYPLFFEDFDLFRRVARAGYRILLVPDAEVVHFAHRSAVTVWDEAMAKSRAARALYMRRHFGWRGALACRWIEWLEERARRRGAPRSRAAPLDLGELHAPPELRLAGPPGPYLLEIAFEPHFALAAAAFGDGDVARLTAPTWSSLLPTRYHLRALHPDTLAPRGAWTFSKAVAAQPCGSPATAGVP